MFSMSNAAPQMASSPVPTFPIAIIGGGFGALMAYGVLRFRGVRHEDIRIFSPDSSPEMSWERQIRAIKLHALRSESIGHFYPTHSPGLATLDAISDWSIRPLVQSWFDRYHPRVDTFIRHTKNIARLTGFYRSLQMGMVGRIERRDGWFALYDMDGNFLAFAQHVIMAIGHGKQHIPTAVSEFRKNYPDDTRVLLGYEMKSYAPPRKTLVVGDGLTAATDWFNILQAGGSVIGLSLRGFSFGQALNCPRGYLFKYGLAPYTDQSDEDRVKEIQSATRGTVPNYPHWRKMYREAQKDGRMELIQGNLQKISLEGDRLKAEYDSPDGLTRHSVIVDQVISATGFMPVTTHPLLAHLIEEYNLETVGGYLKTEYDCCVKGISTPESCLTAIGSAAAWTLPCADQLGGLKINAHRIADTILGPERLSPRVIFAQTMRWFQLAIGKELV